MGRNPVSTGAGRLSTAFAGGALAGAAWVARSGPLVATVKKANGGVSAGQGTRKESQKRLTWQPLYTSQH